MLRRNPVATRIPPEPEASREFRLANVNSAWRRRTNRSFPEWWRCRICDRQHTTIGNFFSQARKGSPSGSSAHLSQIWLSFDSAFPGDVRFQTTSEDSLSLSTEFPCVWSVRTKCNLSSTPRLRPWPTEADTLNRTDNQINQIMKTKLSTAAAIALLAASIDSLAQTPLPHSFASITALPDRTMSLTLTGRVASTLRPYFDIYPIEVSSDLVTWKSLDTVVVANASTKALIYMDGEAAAFSVRFYRTFSNLLVTPLLKPSGPYTVGRVSRLVTDASRTNRYNIKTNSSFMLTIWYPAQNIPGVLLDPYVERRLANFSPSYWDEPGNVSQMFAFSRSNTPVATNQGSYPVVVYSHGYPAHRRQNTQNFEELASHGYMVAAMDHSDCFASLFPDGRLVVGIYSGFTEQEAARTLPDRVKDVRFVLDELTRLNQSDPQFLGRLDLTRLGVLGFSAGVGTVAEAARVDERIKAGVFFEGYLQGATEVRRLGLQKPLLAMYQAGAGDKTLFTKASADAYWCQVRNTEHITFRDLVDSRMANASSRGASAATRACMLSFFDKYLNHEDNHLLDNPTNTFPVIFNYLKK